MSPVSRRIFTYWLLLLVPTLLVGGGAIQLLRREQARLAEGSAEAEAARRAAITARARLVAETVELLVGDVETGLLDTVAAEPAEGLDGFLARWEKTQPLVRTAFRAGIDGRLLRPTGAAEDDHGRGFVRRFARRLAESPPWNTPAGAAAPAPAEAEKKLRQDEPAARREVAANVAQAQSARRDVQELFKSRDYSNLLGATVAAPSAGLAAAAPAVGGDERRQSEADRATIAYAERKKEAVMAASLKDATSERRGWLPLVVDGRLHLLGWVQPAGTDEIRGVEMDLAGLVSRLGGVLPAEMGSGEGYALRDNQARVLHQAGAVPAGGMPVSRVPLAATLLPGWDVVGYLNLSPGRTADSRAVFWAGALLVGIFVAAILAGGSLLLWQARRSEEEALQKTSFVANVSHEFKTPLTTIRLYSELLEQGRVRDAAQGTEYLRTIGRETQRLARLVNNALDFSRLEQGRKKFARERIDLGAELSRLLDTHEPRLGDAGLKLARVLPATPLEITTDRDALEQIVLNLLDNAAKYAAGGGEVTVEVAPRAAGGARVNVADRGPGVPVAHRELIFEKFHRVDEALTAEKTGAGLGLGIARQLARGLGGELRFISRAGGGAEFILELP